MQKQGQQFARFFLNFCPLFFAIFFGFFVFIVLLNQEVSGHCPYNETACQSLVSFVFFFCLFHFLAEPLIN